MEIRMTVVSAANIYKFRKQFTTNPNLIYGQVGLFQLQIYTNFESNSQLKQFLENCWVSCFSCKYIQISKAIHNWVATILLQFVVVSAANIYKFRKQFTTIHKQSNNFDCCFSCKYIQISKAIHNSTTTRAYLTVLFQLQIYTNFESNSQLSRLSSYICSCCFSCKYIQISKAIHNHSARKSHRDELFQLQIYTNFESNSQQVLQLEKWCVGCFSCKYIQISKAIHNRSLFSNSKYPLFQLQIYTNFESNSQLNPAIFFDYNVVSAANIYKFRKQFTTQLLVLCLRLVVSAANIYKFRKQFTTLWERTSLNE